MNDETTTPAAVEIRTSPHAPMLRASDRDDSIGAIDGRAPVYGALSEDLGWFRELIEPGAFAESIENNTHDIRCLWAHDQRQVLGRVARVADNPATMTITDTAAAVEWTVELPDTSAGRDARTTIARGDVDAASFGFWITEETPVWRDGELLFVVHRGELTETSPVAWPAYRSTDVAIARCRQRAMRAAQTLDPADRRSLIETLDAARRPMADWPGPGPVVASEPDRRERRRATIAAAAAQLAYHDLKSHRPGKD